jgi:hypothetical protein
VTGTGGGATGFVVPKAEVPMPEQHDARLTSGRTGMGMYEMVSNEVRRELGIMP